MIPKIPYDDVINGLSEEQKKSIKKTGTVIVKGGVLKDVSTVLHGSFYGAHCLDAGSLSVEASDQRLRSRQWR